MLETYFTTTFKTIFFNVQVNFILNAYWHFMLVFLILICNSPVILKTLLHPDYILSSLFIPIDYLLIHDKAERAISNYTSGKHSPFSHFDTACPETLIFAANSSCVKFFVFRYFFNHSPKAIWLNIVLPSFKKIKKLFMILAYQYRANKTTLYMLKWDG